MARARKPFEHPLLTSKPTTMAQGAQTTIHSFQHYVYIYIYIYTRKYSYIHNNFIQESLHLGFVQIQILRAVEIVEIPDGEDP